MSEVLVSCTECGNALRVEDHGHSILVECPICILPINFVSAAFMARWA